MRLSILMTLLLGSSAMAQVYDAVEIPPLDTGTHNWAFGLNDAGDVVGSSNIRDTAEARGFLWRNATLTDLGVPPCGNHSWARAINESGLMAVTAVDCFGFSVTRRPFVHDGVTLTALPYGSSRTYVRDIDSNGNIVGTMFIDQVIANWPITHAYLWDGTTATDLGTLGGDFSQSLALNESGLVVGGAHIQDNAEYHAFSWQFGTMQDLGTLGGRDSEANDVNEDGLIVGWAENLEGARRPVLWDQGAILDLGTLGSEVGEAEAVNDAGWIVGHSQDAGGNERAFVRNPRRDLVNLNERVISGATALVLQSAQDINGHGQIVGWGRRNGVSRAFVLSPHPVAMTTPSPGQAGQINTVRLTGGTPGERLYLVAGFQQGSAAVPGCQGLFFDMADPRLVASDVADGQGAVDLAIFVPAPLSGATVKLQPLDHSACRLGNRQDITFN
ncbi:MAG: hypothetical protein RL885_02360 [Planctomycetota bacterium]